MKWKRFFDVMKVIGPVVLSLVPGVPAVLVPLIVGAIVEAEKIPGATGKQKKEAATAIVGKAVEIAHAVKTTDGTPSSAEVMGAVDKGIDAAVAAVNVFKQVKDAPPAPVDPT